MSFFKNIWFYIGLVIILWGCSWLLLFAPDHGTLGDMFGAVNALFSGLAFVGVIYALFQQMEGLKMQKEELALQREELRETREEFVKQNETLKRQRFENYFIELLTFQNEVVNSLSGKTQVGKGDKRDLLNKLRLIIMREIEGKEINFDPLKEELKAIASLRRPINEFFHRYESSIYPFFKSVYQILDFVDKSDLISDKDRQYYADQLSYKLTIDEEILLFYYILSDNLFEPKLLELAQKYVLIKNFEKLGLSILSVVLFNNIDKLNQRT